MRRTCPPILAVLLGLVVAALALGAGGAPAAAQEAAQEAAEARLGRDVSQQEILERLRRSGLSRDEARRRLREAGYDPDLLDPYFDRLGRRGEAAGAGEAEGLPTGGPFVQALSDLGLLTPGMVGGEDGRDAGRRLRPGPRPDTGERVRPDTAPGAEQVFGRAVFARSTDQFEAIRTGPVDSGYRLGPGDHLVLVITGDVEQAYTLEVTREGFIVIPDVGRVSVNGLTLSQLRDVLFQRLGEVYSGVRRGEGQSTFFNVSLGELRTNQVFLIGEVERPGSYQVSSVSTVFNALYAAGGPTRLGSFRRVKVRRGGEVVREVDLYEYLLEGNSEDDVRLEQGDVVFVPRAERQVRVEGEVARPATYELVEGETLEDLMRFAGGLRPEAARRRVQIDRILPPEERTPGRSRKLIDVRLAPVLAGEASVPLKNGDVVEVFAVSERRRDRVAVRGAVHQPGQYELRDRMTVWDLIEEAGGLTPEAVRSRAQIVGVRPEDGSLTMETLSLERDSAGRPVEDVPLQEFDEVLVYSRERLRQPASVSISGWVQEPGTYPLAEGMTVKDLVLAAGGLREGAYVRRAEVSRLNRGQEWSDSISRVLEVPVDSTYVFAREAEGDTVRAPAGRMVESFDLRAFDRVYIRRSPGFEVPRDVVVTGQVRFPGEYALTSRRDRLTDVLERAGGLTPNAYPEGFQLWRPEVPAPETGRGQRHEVGIDTTRRMEDAAREMTADSLRGSRTDTARAARIAARQADETGARTRVGVSLPRAMADPDGRANVLVEPGDSLHVPRYQPTVTVRGAVGVPTKVLWREGAGLSYYINRAGGFAQNADEDRTRVRFANGDVATKGGGFLFFSGSVPDPDPGSEITVPPEPVADRGGGLTTGQWITLITSVVGSLTTIVVASN